MLFPPFPPFVSQSVSLSHRQLQQFGRFEHSETPARGHQRVHILKEPVHVPHRYSEDMILNRPPEEKRHSRKNPGEIRSPDGEEEYVHPSSAVASTPHVGHHINQGTRKEIRRPEKIRQPQEHPTRDDDHPEKGGRLAAERGLFERTAIVHQDISVPEKREPKISEEEKTRHKSPQLIVPQHETPVEVKSEGRDQVQRAQNHQTGRGQEVRLGHWRDLKKVQLHFYLYLQTRKGTGE
mmetsp:Transcript_37896/g.74517  ORF Transcript_37896/g.74517 Transcript_37896/m.74517 type:complete len:237 (-) Transcript_37896:401-1111(-)